MNISILADYRKEFRVNAIGAVVASMRGVARICDVSEQAISKNLRDNLSCSKLAQMLKDKGFEPDNLAKDGFPDTAVAIVVEYYAFEAGRYCTEQAKSFYRLFASIGIRAFLKEWLESKAESKAKKCVIHYGSLLNSGVTRKGYTWRVFSFCNPVNGTKTLIPVVYVDNVWYLQTRAVIKGFNVQRSVSVDLTIDFDEFDWMFLSTIEKSGNFCTVNSLEKVFTEQNLMHFANWSKLLNVFAEPEVQITPVTKVTKEVKELDVKKPQDLLFSKHELTVFHSFATRLINEVHFNNTMGLSNEQLKGEVLAVAFDILKYISKV